MNFYPYFTYFLVIILDEDEKELFEKIFNHLSRKIPYAKVTLEDEKINVSGGDNNAYLQFRKMKSRVKKLKLSRGIRYRVIEITSGPNHDMSYYPVFKDVELAMMEYEHSYLWKNDNLLYSTKNKETVKDFEKVVKKLYSIIKDSEGYRKEYALNFFHRVREVFPDIFQEGTIFNHFYMSLLHA